MKRLLEINSSLDSPARVGLHPDGEMMVMMGVPVMSPFGLPAEAFRKLFFSFVAVVEELIDLVDGMASPFRGVFEGLSKPCAQGRRTNPPSAAFIQHLGKLLESRKIRLGIKSLH
jgi:hypothetical protein